MIKHIVFWKFSSEDDQKEAIHQLETLPALIDDLVDFEVGVNFNPSDAAYDVVLYTTFHSLIALETYQQHHAHQEVAEFIKKCATERAVVDYEIADFDEDDE